MLDRQIALLWTELEKPAYAAEIAAKHWQAITDALNVREEVPNPVPQPTRPKLIAWDAFMGLLTAADVLKLFGYGILADHLKQALAENNRPVTLAIWRGLKTVLVAASITAVEGEANKTEADPTWQATILQPSIAQGLDLPVVMVEDVMTACHRFAGG